MKIVKYGADWCGPCRTLSELLKNSGLNYEEIDINEHPEAFDNKDISEIPYVEIVDDSGEVYEVFEHGLEADDLIEIEEKYGQSIFK